MAMDTDEAVAPRPLAPLDRLPWDHAQDRFRVQVPHNAPGGARVFGPQGPRRRRRHPLAATGGSGYTLARMRFEILLAPEAVDDLRALKANLRAAVQEALDTHLRHEPTKVSKSRIKRLRGLSRPQYRLRVGEVRVFYDVTRDTVEVLAVVAKSEAESWLAQFGSPE